MEDKRINRFRIVWFPTTIAMARARHKIQAENYKKTDGQMKNAELIGQMSGMSNICFRLDSNKLSVALFSSLFMYVCVKIVSGCTIPQFELTFSLFWNAFMTFLLLLLPPIVFRHLSAFSSHQCIVRNHLFFPFGYFFYCCCSNLFLFCSFNLSSHVRHISSTFARFYLSDAYLAFYRYW